MMNPRVIGIVLIGLILVGGIALLVTGENSATSLSPFVKGCSTTTRAQLSGSFVINDAGFLTISPEVQKISSVSVRPLPLSFTGFLGSSQDVTYDVRVQDAITNDDLGNTYESHGVVSKKNIPNNFNVIYEAPYNSCTQRLEDQQLSVTIDVKEVGNIPVIIGNDQATKTFTCNVVGGRITC